MQYRRAPTVTQKLQQMIALKFHLLVDQSPEFFA